MQKKLDEIIELISNTQPQTSDEGQTIRIVGWLHRRRLIEYIATSRGFVFDSERITKHFVDYTLSVAPEFAEAFGIIDKKVDAMARLIIAETGETLTVGRHNVVNQIREALGLPDPAEVAAAAAQEKADAKQAKKDAAAAKKAEKAAKKAAKAEAPADADAETPVEDAGDDAEVAEADADAANADAAADDAAVETANAEDEIVHDVPVDAPVDNGNDL